MNLARRLGVPIEENATPAALADLIHEASLRGLRLAGCAETLKAIAVQLGLMGTEADGVERIDPKLFADRVFELKAGGNPRALAALEEWNTRQRKMIEDRDARIAELKGEHLLLSTPRNHRALDAHAVINHSRRRGRGLQALQRELDTGGQHDYAPSDAPLGGTVCVARHRPVARYTDRLPTPTCSCS